MAATNFTPIQLYYSTTASAVPVNTNLANGELAINITDGKLFYKDNSNVVQVIGWKTVPISAGGTGQTSASAAFNALSPITTTGDLIIGNGTNSATRLAIGTNGYVLTSNGTTATWSAATAGTVTAVSVASANGFAGTSSGGATPALTLTTSISGVLKGNGTAISAATAGTDYVAPGTATTFTALQTFSGSTSVAAATLTNAKEVATISATAATGTINYDVTTQSVLYYTSNASANWTVNFRGSSGTSLNTLMATGESVTAAFLVTQGATAYYNSAVTVDGTSVTPKWQGGTAPSAGNASSIDSYVYTIVKVGAASFTILASQTQFK